MTVSELSRFSLGDITVSYLIDEAGQVGLTLTPADRAGVGSPTTQAVDPVIHVAIRGDGVTAGWAQGRTMRWSPTNKRFAYREQEVAQEGVDTRILTTLGTADGLTALHVLRHRDAEPFVEVHSVLTNGSPVSVTVDALTSFCLSGLSPFDDADSTGRLVVHRMRSAWSAEGRPVAERVEELHLERSWSGAAQLSERFGQVGSMPVRGWFPFLAVEDTVADVTWGAQLAWAGSWQLEIARQHDDVVISGGLADREFGHWSHLLTPGAEISTPVAILSCTAGSVDELADRLVSAQRRDADAQPEQEAALPIVFNEWCTSWGEPNEASLEALATRLAGTGVEYLVIDAGWYRGNGPWYTAHGDWMPSVEHFPRGLSGVAAFIREQGMTPGLWFEVETVGESSTAFTLTDHLLHRDGEPLTVGARRFWDLTDPFAVEYLTQKVVGLLDECGFGYLKIDYNETIGIGADHPEGLGEGLRQQVLAWYRFIDGIRERLPHLVIENCASGGHRLEPSMIGRTSMSSFSDAHEVPEIPLIAANLLRVMLPRQMQIWSVLRKEDSDQRLVYSLAATFLGRMCLSGDALELTEQQWDIVSSAIALYQESVPTIREGTSRRVGEWGSSMRHPVGWQCVIRRGTDGTSMLVVVHTFEDAPDTVEVPLQGRWEQAATMAAGPTVVLTEDGDLRVERLRPFDAVVLLLRTA